MKDYFLGLDIGSGSVGWAVTDNEYNILRSHGKDLWGSRLFDAANTAAERRNFRTGRRRNDRQRWRLDLLQSIFADEINAVDDGFFLRLKESRYVPEDKRDKEGNCPVLPYSLFVGKDLTDVDYHKQFPTIYHLRKYLMETNNTPDIRLVYLAFHHMMKHRGHFLLSGSIDKIREFDTTFSMFLETVSQQELGFTLVVEKEVYPEIEKILKDKHISKNDKPKQLDKLMTTSTKQDKTILELISGKIISLSKLFEDKELDDCEQPKICFSDVKYDEYENKVHEILGERFIIIESAKAVYDWAVLADILGKYGSISEAKVALFNKHKDDLNYLKNLVKVNIPNSYKLIFEDVDQKANYCAYIGMSKKNGKKQVVENKKCSQKDFYAFIKKNVIDVIHDSDKVEALQKEIDAETFLPKLSTNENSVVPYQIHLHEMKTIINNLQDRIPLLKQQGNKILSIFEFRIPYYVGPLNGVVKNGERTNWIQRKQEGKIYPWNFEDMVDIDKSAENFIRRMTNKCSYLYQEDVIPKNSLLYSKFMVLNELNNVRVDGKEISVELKQHIYEDLFQKTRKVTQKKLIKYLEKNRYSKNAEITGIDGDFKASLTAYHDFKQKLTDVTLTDEEKESIILNITLFGADKSLLRNRLNIQFPQLTEKQIGALCTLTYEGWGTLSKKFLDGITTISTKTGEQWTIIRALWETNDNLMQLLSQKYSFSNAIEKENQQYESNEITYKSIENLYVSPAVRRQIWQTLLIVKEVKKVMKQAPRRIFVEMAREHTTQGRTVSRRNILIDLYKHCKNEERNWIEELNHTDDATLRSDKLYLYYTQKGRCMYTGEVIELSELWDNKKYDIDHIYPQSKVKDDSLDNRVLVKKQSNEDKSDVYPLDATIREKMTSFWKMLLQQNFISKEKYNRLTRSTPFDDNELAGFIARQLVETRQGTKAVASILKQMFPETDIVYVKAPTVSQFRQDFDFIKVRDMNDLHHAKDAYLNIVVGNVYFTKFTNNPLQWIQKNPNKKYNIRRMFKSFNVERNGEVAWNTDDNGTIHTVRKMMDKNSILVTRRTFEVTGEFYDQMLMKKGKGQIPIKSTDDRLQDISKYGGYNKESGAYFILVESDDKKGKKRTIEYVPIRLKSKLEKSKDAMIQYLIDNRQLSNPRILINKIAIDTLFEVDGFLMSISGRTGNQIIFKCATQLLLSGEYEQILKKIIKFVNRSKKNPNLKIYESDDVSDENLIDLYEEFIRKLVNTTYGIKLSAQEKTLRDKKEIFKSLSIEDKCKVLYEILHMFQCNSESANLKGISGPGSAGEVKISKNIDNCKSIKIIHQSPTGIFEKIIDLKKI